MWVSDGDGCAGGEEKERKTEAKVDGQHSSRMRMTGLQVIVRNHLLLCFTDVSHIGCIVLQLSTRWSSLIG